ncbi:hypothetical protein [Anaerovorax odorimutans]|uniref:hypothetical protein n=1 Tax=Anaerovorax odorimutans TaxID=109327 RepID=UPI000405083C|nr:hypothetical protein [Anaerovorax odorimutans]
MKNYSIYIKINEEKNLIHTSGITFKEFFKGIDINNRGFLILAGYPYNCEFNMNLFLEYVTKSQAEAFADEDVYSFGDFCWVDFEEEEQLNCVTKDELAELLYMSHMKEPLYNFKIKSLNNKYSYLCHDDGWWNNVYIDNTEEYKRVIKYKLMKEFKGRRKIICEPNNDLIEIVYKMCKEGLVIDFEKKEFDSVNLFCVGDIATMDDLEIKIDRYRNKLGGLSITYNSRKKLWEYY